MPQFQFTLVGGVDTDGQPVQHVSVLISPEVGFKITDSGHPMFGAIVSALQSPDTTQADLLDLFSVERGINRAIADANLSSRVSVVDGQIVMDGEVMDNALANHILGLMAEQSGDLTGWVRFMERIEANTNEHSRKAAFDWIASLGRNDQGFTTVPENGFLVGYKGVTARDGSFFSITRGPAIVDGVEHTGGPVPNAIGSIVEMKRDDVQHDPSIGCSRGLHVGTWNYAKSWSQGAVIEVHVDPADIVSVPTDCDAQKMRCSKYKVVKVLDAPYTSATLPVDGSDEDNDDYAYDDDGACDPYDSYGDDLEWGF